MAGKPAQSAYATAKVAPQTVAPSDMSSDRHNSESSSSSFLGAYDVQGRINRVLQWHVKRSTLDIRNGEKLRYDIRRSSALAKKRGPNGSFVSSEGTTSRDTSPRASTDGDSVRRRLSSAAEEAHHEASGDPEGALLASVHGDRRRGSPVPGSTSSGPALAVATAATAGQLKATAGPYGTSKPKLALGPAPTDQADAPSGDDSCSDAGSEGETGANDADASAEDGGLASFKTGLKKRRRRGALKKRLSPMPKRRRRYSGKADGTGEELTSADSPSAGRWRVPPLDAGAAEGEEQGREGPDKDLPGDEGDAFKAKKRAPVRGRAAAASPRQDEDQPYSRVYSRGGPSTGQGGRSTRAGRGSARAGDNADTTPIAVRRGAGGARSASASGYHSDDESTPVRSHPGAAAGLAHGLPPGDTAVGYVPRYAIRDDGVRTQSAGIPAMYGSWAPPDHSSGRGSRGTASNSHGTGSHSEPASGSSSYIGSVSDPGPSQAHGHGYDLGVGAGAMPALPLPPAAYHGPSGAMPHGGPFWPGTAPMPAPAPAGVPSAGGGYSSSGQPGPYHSTMGHQATVVPAQRLSFHAGTGAIPRAFPALPLPAAVPTATQLAGARGPVYHQAGPPRPAGQPNFMPGPEPHVPAAPEDWHGYPPEATPEGSVPESSEGSGTDAGMLMAMMMATQGMTGQAGVPMSGMQPPAGHGVHGPFAGQAGPVDNSNVQWDEGQAEAQDQGQEQEQGDEVEDEEGDDEDTRGYEPVPAPSRGHPGQPPFSYPYGQAQTMPGPQQRWAVHPGAPGPRGPAAGQAPRGHDGLLLTPVKPDPEGNGPRFRQFPPAAAQGLAHPGLMQAGTGPGPARSTQWSYNGPAMPQQTYIPASAGTSQMPAGHPRHSLPPRPQKPNFNYGYPRGPMPGYGHPGGMPYPGPSHASFGPGPAQHGGMGHPRPAQAGPGFGSHAGHGPRQPFFHPGPYGGGY